MLFFMVIVVCAMDICMYYDVVNHHILMILEKWIHIGYSNIAVGFTVFWEMLEIKNDKRRNKKKKLSDHLIDEND